MTRDRLCTVCLGSGSSPCSHCKGSGSPRSPRNGYEARTGCLECQGALVPTCARCGGLGRLAPKRLERSLR